MGLWVMQINVRIIQVAIIALILCSFSQPSVISREIIPRPTAESFTYSSEGLNVSAPIKITDESDFEDVYSFPGNGSPTNPYLIENLYIDLNSSSIDDDWWSENYAAIFISRVSSRYIIRNCTLIGEGRWDYDPVYVEPVFDIRGFGIHLESMRYGKIYNNTIILQRKAIYVWNVHDCEISGNNIYGNAMSDSPTNYGVEGVHIAQYSSQNNVTFNRIRYCSSGALITLSADNYIYNNTIQNSTIGIFIRSESDENSIFFNNCSYCHTGMGLSKTWNNNVSFNIICWNIASGIYITDTAYDNVIVNNLIAGTGIAEDSLLPTSEVALSQEHVGYGVFIDKEGNNNRVLQNDMIANLKNAVNDVPENNYDYNYWSDYAGIDQDTDGIGDTPYEIDGLSVTSDPHPRMIPVYDFDINSSNTTDFQNGPQDTLLTTEIVVTLTITFAIIALIVVFVKRKSSS